MRRYRIAVIAGDGIGQEVIPAGIDVLEVVAAQHGFSCEFVHFPWRCHHYLRTGRMMDGDGLEQLRGFDASR